MKELMVRLFFRASEALGTWTAFEVTTDADRAGCMRVIEKVRRDELNRVTGASAIESTAFAGHDVTDRMFAVRQTKTGEIVGCVRALVATELASIESSREEYAFDRIPESLLPSAGVLTRLVLLPEHRTSAAGITLLQTLFRQALVEGWRIGLLACEPGLFPLYLRLGFRPLGRCHASPTGGFRIPMIMLNHDVAHLKRVGSPLLGLVTSHGPDPACPALAWYRDLEAREGRIDPGVRFYRYGDEAGEDEGAGTDVLTAGMSAAGAARLVENAVIVPCAAGQVVLREGDGGRQIGIVRRGLLEVVAGDRVLALLGPGELFGELAYVLAANRTARVVAATPDTEVMLLSQRCLDRVENPSDVARFWQNLSVHLATRLVRTSRAAAGSAPHQDGRAPA